MITLEHTKEDGTNYRALFDPERGMNLKSFSLGEIEVIDQSTVDLFEERNAGLGALIGPHFHQRKAETLPPLPKEVSFPHLQKAKDPDRKDPFSHGIARYVPWKYEQKGSTFQATLSGKDRYQDCQLKDLEGYDFVMQFSGSLGEQGLFLHLDVRSETDSVIGLHYYYALPEEEGTITSFVAKECCIDGSVQSLPDHFSVDEQRQLTVSLPNEIDCGFYPYRQPAATEITLHTKNYRLVTQYRANSQENCWQCYSPSGRNFVCIEPLTAANPKKPQLTVSALDVNLSIQE